MESFQAILAADSGELIQWRIRDQGFDMVLPGGVPRAVEATLRRRRDAILAARGQTISVWAVHPGGRSVLDAVHKALAPPPAALAASVLHDFGNMLPGTVMFVLDRLMRRGSGDAPCPSLPAWWQKRCAFAWPPAPRNWPYTAKGLKKIQVVGAICQNRNRKSGIIRSRDRLKGV
jgi:hypothetical protein